MKIWTPEQPSRHYAASILLPLIGSVLLAVVLAGGAALLALRQGWPVAPISLAGCALAVFFALWAALAVGRRAQQGALIFCQTAKAAFLPWMRASLSLIIKAFGVTCKRKK